MPVQYLDANGNPQATPPVYLDPSSGEPIKAESQTQTTIPEGFWHSLGSQFGMTPEAAKAAAQDQKDHPIKSLLWDALGPAGIMAKGLYEQAKQSGGEIGQAYQSAKEGNPASAAVHAITAVPIIGPALAKGADQYAQGNTAGEMGTLVGASAQAAPAILGAADAAVPGRPLIPNPSLPSRANAAAAFGDLNTKLAQQPVPLKSTLVPLQRATEIGARGGTLPKAVSDLLTRSQSPIEMTFPEARDYQMSLTDLSRADVDAVSPRMKGQISKINQGLFNDIHAAAEAHTTGLGGDFADAMKEYRQAAQIRSAATTLAKKVIPAAAGTGIAAHYLKELIP